MGMFDHLNANAAAAQAARPPVQPPVEPPPRRSGPFGGIGDARVNDGGVYPRPGKYGLLYVVALKMIESRRGKDMFVAELGIIQSSVVDRPAGTSMSWVANLTDHDAALGNVKALLAAVSGCTPAEVDEAGAEAAISDAQPLAGRLVGLEATEITTKAGNPFTVCRWIAIPEDVQRNAATLAEQAGLAPF